MPSLGILYFFTFSLMFDTFVYISSDAACLLCISDCMINFKKTGYSGQISYLRIVPIVLLTGLWVALRTSFFRYALKIMKMVLFWFWLLQVKILELLEQILKYLLIFAKVAYYSKFLVFLQRSIIKFRGGILNQGSLH